MPGEEVCSSHCKTKQFELSYFLKKYVTRESVRDEMTSQCKDLDLVVFFVFVKL